MLFNSWQYALFFPLVAVLYFNLPHRFRWIWLLAASAYFYMAFIPKYILILIALILVDYTAGILIEGAEGRKRKAYFLGSIAANLGILFFYKYFNFINDNLRELFGAVSVDYPVERLSIILPIGLSFHTFQSLSYTTEVYFRKQAAERHLGYYALYVLFFPQLVAGPIERPQNVLPQLREEHFAKYDEVIAGLKQIFVGLFKKVIIADSLAGYVSTVYGNPSAATSIQTIVAVYFFSIQIYCDFSGYSDVALGSARVLGIKLMKNFDRPYFASSVPEFWKRWHISLSTWFRDYVYVPLAFAGDLSSKWKHFRNTMIVFLLSGLWHGANWTFVFWGGLHGLFVGLTDTFAKRKKRKKKPAEITLRDRASLVFKVLLTFHFVTFSYIFFRATRFSDAIEVIRKIFSVKLAHADLSEVLELMRPIEFGFVVFVIALLVFLQILESRRPLWDWLNQKPVLVRWAAYTASVSLFIYGIAIRVGGINAKPFLYFQF